MLYIFCVICQPGNQLNIWRVMDRSNNSISSAKWKDGHIVLTCSNHSFICQHHGTTESKLNKLSDMTFQYKVTACAAIVKKDPCQKYRKISNIRHTKSPNLNVPRLVLQFYLPKLFMPGIKSRMKM